MQNGRTFFENHKSQLLRKRSGPRVQVSFICAKNADKKREHQGQFFLYQGSKKINWLSTNWPAKVDITGVASRDTVVITLSLGSTLTSITQAGSNTNKLELIASNIKALLS